MVLLRNHIKKWSQHVQHLKLLLMLMAVSVMPNLAMAQLEQNQNTVSNGAGLVSGGNYTGYASVGQMATYMYANGTQIATQGIILNEISGNVEFTFELNGTLTQNNTLKSGALRMKSAAAATVGPPLAFVNVYLIDESTGSVLFQTQTDANGYFEFKSIPYKNYYFTINEPVIPPEPILLSFESNIFIKEVEVNGEVGTQGVSAEVTVTPNNNCDSTSADYAIWYLDYDGDGFGTSNFSVGQCTQPVGYVLNDLDCNDGDAGINPDAVDIAGSGIDANCDGYYVWYVDADGDYFGGELIDSSMTDSPGAGYSDNNLDCNDDNPNINPGAIEVPGSGIDTNCDGELPCSSVIEIVEIIAPSAATDINESVDVSAIIEGENLVSAIWHWGDGTTSDANAEGNFLFGSHFYAESGLYDITLTVANDCVEPAEKVYSYVVVVDYCSGETEIKAQGDIMSPTGSSSFESNTAGAASFKLEYEIDNKKNKLKLKSKFSFDFKKGGFKFKESTTEWIVVKDNLAYIKGTGKIEKDKTYYNYLVSVIDSKKGKEYFRLVVWDDFGEILYDSQPGDFHAALPTALISRGSVKVKTDCDRDKEEDEDDDNDDDDKGKNKSATISDDQLLDDSATFEIKAYPNPTTGIVNIAINFADFKKMNVMVFNAMGQRVFERTYHNSNHLQLDLSGKTPGLYYVHCQVDQNIVTKKIILNRK